jgi:SAM-dependent methyltransferase
MGNRTRFVAAASALALVLATPALYGEELPRELDWIPGGVRLVIGCQNKGGAPAALFHRFKSEILFAAKLDERFGRLAEAAGLDVEQGIDRIVLGAGPEGMVAVVEAPLLEAPRALRAAGPLDPRHAASAVYLGAGEPPWGLAVLDQGRLVFGDMPLLRRSLDLHCGLARDKLTQDPELAALARGAGAGSDVWAAATGSWLGIGLDAGRSADVRGRSLRRSLAAIRSLRVSASVVSSEVLFQMRTLAGDPEDGRLLADELRSFFASRAANSGLPPAVREAVESAQTRLEGSEVSLRMTLSPAALERLRRNEDSRRLLGWRLGSEEREGWQGITQIVERLGLAEGARVADVGSGDGFFSVRLARAVGESGRVYAVDIGEKAVAGLRRRAQQAGLGNVEVILGEAEDPKLPPGVLDAVLIVNSYHEMPAHESMLRRIHEALKPGGRLVLVEPYKKARRGEPRASQVRDHLIAPEIAEEELRSGGFEIVERSDDFVARPNQDEWLIAARRPAAAAGGR